MKGRHSISVSSLRGVQRIAPIALCLFAFSLTTGCKLGNDRSALSGEEEVAGTSDDSYEVKVVPAKECKVPPKATEVPSMDTAGQPSGASLAVVEPAASAPIFTSDLD